MKPLGLRVDGRCADAAADKDKPVLFQLLVRHSCQLGGLAERSDKICDSVSCVKLGKLRSADPDWLIDKFDGSLFSVIIGDGQRNPFPFLPDLHNHKLSWEAPLCHARCFDEHLIIRASKVSCLQNLVHDLSSILLKSYLSGKRYF